MVAVVVLLAIVASQVLTAQRSGAADVAGGMSDPSATVPESCPPGSARVSVSSGETDAELTRALAAAWQSSDDPLACGGAEVVTGLDAQPSLVIRRAPDVGGTPVVAAEDPRTFATTVALVALQPAVAGGLGWPGTAPTAGAVLGAITGPGGGTPGTGLAVADPTTSTTGLLGVAGLSTAASGTALPDFPPDRSSDPAVQGALYALFNAVTVEAATEPEIVQAYADAAAGASPPALIVDEAAVARWNTTTPDTPLAPVYLDAGTPTVEITSRVVTRGDEAQVQAARSLQSFIESAAALDIIEAQGYRAPDATLGQGVRESLATAADGVDIAGQDSLVGPPPQELLDSLSFGWAGATNPGRYILVMDVSGSMADEVPGTGRTKLQFAQEAAVQAVTTAPRTGEIGLWEFSTDLDGDRAYRELVPNGLVTEVLDTRSRREVLTAAIEGLVPRADTGLYDTALASFRRAQEQYQPGESNLVVLLTDGRNDPPGALDLDGLVSTLEREQDPARPVGILTIAYGEDADPAALGRIAEATGGLAYVSPNPAQIGQVLVAAFSGGRAGLLPGSDTGPAVPGN